MTDTRKYYTVTLEVDQYEETLTYTRTFAEAVSYAAQYLENRFDGDGMVDAVTYSDNVVRLFKQGVYTYSCYVRPQEVKVD